MLPTDEVQVQQITDQIFKHINSGQNIDILNARFQFNFTEESIEKWRQKRRDSSRIISRMFQQSKNLTFISEKTGLTLTRIANQILAFLCRNIKKLCDNLNSRKVLNRFITFPHQNIQNLAKRLLKKSQNIEQKSQNHYSELMKFLSMNHEQTFLNSISNGKLLDFYEKMITIVQNKTKQFGVIKQRISFKKNFNQIKPQIIDCDQAFNNQQEGNKVIKRAEAQTTNQQIPRTYYQRFQIFKDSPIQLAPLRLLMRRLSFIAKNHKKAQQICRILKLKINCNEFIDKLNSHIFIDNLSKIKFQRSMTDNFSPYQRRLFAELILDQIFKYKCQDLKNPQVVKTQRQFAVLMKKYISIYSEQFLDQNKWSQYVKPSADKESPYHQSINQNLSQKTLSLFYREIKRSQYSRFVKNKLSKEFNSDKNNVRIDQTMKFLQKIELSKTNSFKKLVEKLNEANYYEYKGVLRLLKSFIEQYFFEIVISQYQGQHFRAQLVINSLKIKDEISRILKKMPKNPKNFKTYQKNVNILKQQEYSKNQQILRVQDICEQQQVKSKQDTLLKGMRQQPKQFSQKVQNNNQPQKDIYESIKPLQQEADFQRDNSSKIPEQSKDYSKRFYNIQIQNQGVSNKPALTKENIITIQDQQKQQVLPGFNKPTRQYIEDSHIDIVMKKYKILIDRLQLESNLYKIAVQDYIIAHKEKSSIEQFLKKCMQQQEKKFRTVQIQCRNYQRKQKILSKDANDNNDH